MKTPTSLRRWFIIHFAVDIIFGIPLLLFPEQLLKILSWPSIDAFTARLVGAALIGIGSVSFTARNASQESHRYLLQLKIIWSTAAIIGILISMKQGYPAIGWFVLAIFAVFSIAWWYYYIRLK
jgi:hypothetical protein